MTLVINPPIRSPEFMRGVFTGFLRVFRQRMLLPDALGQTESETANRDGAQRIGRGKLAVRERRPPAASWRQR